MYVAVSIISNILGVGVGLSGWTSTRYTFMAFLINMLIVFMENQVHTKQFDAIFDTFLKLKPEVHA